MDKFLIRKDVYGELIEKGYGKKDLSKLTKKKITDKNGHTRTVYVRNGEQPATQQQPKAQDELTPEKKARYEEMLEQVKAGPEENALFVRGKGMLNKKDAIAHLEAKLGKKTISSAAQEPGIPIQGSNWISLPSGTRVTNEGAKEKIAKNNERIETLKKLMEGNTKADNFRLNSELRSLQNENEYIASRLPSEREETKEVDFQKWLEDNDIVPEEMAGESHAQIYKKVKKTGLDDDAAMKITGDIMAYNEAYKSEEPDSYKKKSSGESKNSVNGFTLDDIYHHGSDKKWPDVKKIDDMETAKGVVEMIAQKYGATDKGREQLMDFIAYNIGGTNPLYDKLYEEYGVDADDLGMDFEASHDLILNQAMGKDTKKNREQIADSKSDFERRYRQMLEREG
jgi:hypothetical protein